MSKSQEDLLDDILEKYRIDSSEKHTTTTNKKTDTGGALVYFAFVGIFVFAALTGMMQGFVALLIFALVVGLFS